MMKNLPLNNAFEECCVNRFEWAQSNQSMLCENGFGYVWDNPMAVDKDSFHKYFST